eukprot:TRINITY_DN1000_c0_g1_i1.p1 TRINITY_DN1000_c0_g1~~TRINITY_DN1000_c0_g1_i1.p1  ORF type:complete len:815 (+),score=194.66 TRINITY_DN1000_c0_g1_i1:121-2565(+)
MEYDDDEASAPSDRTVPSVSTGVTGATSGATGAAGFSPFGLRSEFLAHNDSVKCVSSGGLLDTCNVNLISCSRDHFCVTWEDVDDCGSFQSSQMLSDFEATADCLKYVSPCKLFPTGAVILGGDHGNCTIFAGPSSRIRLVGHAGKVVAIDVWMTEDEGFLIATGSWDSTVCLWNPMEMGAVGSSGDPGVRELHPAQVLRGHELPVWGVLFLSDGSLLSASADRTIKMWKDGTAIRTFEGHKDVVRSMKLLDDESNKFCSCSNDSSIIIWDIPTAQPIATLHGHTHFVYDLDVMDLDLAGFPSRAILSCGEDRTARIWDTVSLKCLQTIQLPSLAWSISHISRSEFAVGCDDHHVRVFSNVSSRMASEEVRKEYDDRISSQTISQRGLGLENIPVSDRSALMGPGKKDGEIKIVKDQTNGALVAYSYDASRGEWTRIGDVVTEADETSKPSKMTFEGKEYDFVFDVEVEGRDETLKLPYDLSDHPAEAARMFILRYGLPESCLDETVQFIYTNTQAYRKEEDEHRPQPFFPRTYYSEVTINISRVMHAIEEKNTQIASDLRLTEVEVKKFGTMMKLIDGDLEQKKLWTRIRDGEKGIIDRMLETWPLHTVLPAADVCRILAAMSSGTPTLPRTAIPWVRKVIFDHEIGKDSEIPQQIIAIYTLANAMSSEDHRKILVNEISIFEILDLLQKSSNWILKTGLHLPLATLAANTSLMLDAWKADGEDDFVMDDVVTHMIKIADESARRLIGANVNERVTNRWLIAIGNVLSLNRGSQKAQRAVSETLKLDIARTLKSGGIAEHVKKLYQELVNLFH